jgi:hypothetical protein
VSPLPLFFVSVADKGVTGPSRLRVNASFVVRVPWFVKRAKSVELEERSECHPGCFAARVRKGLKGKEMRFSLLRKSEKEWAAKERVGRS